MSIRIHPSIGVARLGNSPEGKLLVPNKIGGLPHEFKTNLDGYDSWNQNNEAAINFKDELGRIKRQGQPFRIYDDKNVEITIDRSDIESIEWTVHLANKKAEWYEYHELQGNLLYPKNSYKENGFRYKDGKYPLRNNDVKDRSKLILDPGPKSIKVIKGQTKSQVAYLTKNGQPFKEKDEYLATGKYGNSIETLGEIHVDKKGRLVVFGGHGNTCGDKDLAGYGGGDTWHDDISDGSITCKVTFKHTSSNKSESNLAKAWCIVGSPDFAPEIVNISTLYDTMLDLGIHNFGTEYKGSKKESILVNNVYNKEYNAIYERDIHPIFERMARYQWVGNVQPMVNFGLFTYDHKIDVNSVDVTRKDDILKHRSVIYNYFRQLDGYSKNDDGISRLFDEKDTFKFYHESNSEPSITDDKKMRTDYPQDKYPNEYLFKDQNTHLYLDDKNNEVVEFGNVFPMMPLNAGSGVPRNENPLKFVSLTKTQLFLLKQWSEGKCISHPDYKHEEDASYKDSISIGNCIGLPMSPGIEVTWTVHNPVIYDSAFNIKHAELKNYKLTTTVDECEPIDPKKGNIGRGCEPGDLTKRMACPWQSDFLACTIQPINFSNPAQARHYVVGDDVEIENAKIDDVISNTLPAPLYYTHWWPAQSPWEVIVGDFTLKRQIANGGFEAGRQMNYQRGINSFDQMVNYWDTLGFIRDINYKNDGFPYIVETERNHEFFTAKKPTVGEIMHTGRDKEVEVPIFYIEDWKANAARANQTVTPKSCGEALETATILDNPSLNKGANKNIIFEGENNYKEYKKQLIESIKNFSLKNLGSDARR